MIAIMIVKHDDGSLPAFLPSAILLPRLLILRLELSVVMFCDKHVTFYLYLTAALAFELLFSRFRRKVEFIELRPSFDVRGYWYTQHIFSALTSNVLKSQKIETLNLYVLYKLKLEQPHN